MTAENVKTAVSRSKISVEEARMILGVDAAATREEITKRFEHLMKVNEEHGTFYLQSKIFRAKERLDLELGPEEGGTAGAGGAGPQGQGTEGDGRGPPPPS
jgi:hypothetical protein